MWAREFVCASWQAKSGQAVCLLALELGLSELPGDEMPLFTVVHLKRSFEIDVPAPATVARLKEAIETDGRVTDAKASRFRLIVSGKLLKDDAEDLESLKLDRYTKITLILGAEPGARVPTLPRHLQTRIFDDFSGVSRGAAPPPVTPTTLSSRSRFREIQVLPGLPQQDRARALLLGFANHPGFIAVMEKHGWTVGALCELYPEGQVGVDPVCILGLNENHGQRILLRLRTDDLEGFRDAETKTSDRIQAEKP